MKVWQARYGKGTVFCDSFSWQEVGVLPATFSPCICPSLPSRELAGMEFVLGKA